MNEYVEDEIKSMGYKLTDLGNNQSLAEFKECNWWKLRYLFLKISVYYDPKDILGAVGVPYYEMFDGKDTIRYIAGDKIDEKTFLEDMKYMKKKHDLSLDTEPEIWL
jgi:hypothetical protein